MIEEKKTVSGKWTLVFLGTVLFFTVPVVSQNLPDYQGVKPPVNSDNTETEAQLQDDTGPLCYKNCDREVNAQRDRSPHDMSPQEVRNLVQRIVKKTPPTAPPPTDGDGSR